MGEGEQTGGSPADPRTGELLGSLDPAVSDLRSRLDELQRDVEQLGREELTGRPAEGADEPAVAPAPAALAVGPIPGLVDLRLLEDGIAEAHGVAGVRVRWFGRRWARIDVATAGPAELGQALLELGRPMDLEPDAGGLLVARFADVVGPPEPVPAEAKLPALTGGSGSVDPAAAQRLPEAVCRHFWMVPIAFDRATLTVAIADPADRLACDVAAALTGAAVTAVPTRAELIEEMIEAAFGAAGEGVSPAAPDQTQRLADEFGMPMIDLEGIEPVGEALELIPRELQRELGCVPLEVDDVALYVAVSAPLGGEATAKVGDCAGGRGVRAFLAPMRELEAFVDRLHAEAPATLHSPPPTAFPGNQKGKRKRRKRRWIAAVPLAVWSFLRAPVPIGLALVAVAALVYLYLYG
jgi:hypothetical protein